MDMPYQSESIAKRIALTMKPTVKTPRKAVY